MNATPPPRIPSLRQYFLGAMEVNLFMRQGLARFPQDAHTMAWSFLVPLALMPITALALYATQDQRPELSGISVAYMMALFLGKGAANTIIGLLVLYVFAKAYNRLERVCHVITLGNWAGLWPSLIFFPAVLALLSGWCSWEQLYPVSVVFSLYAYVLSAYILTRGLFIPWEMGGFLAIIGMAINETGFDVLYWLAS